MKMDQRKSEIMEVAIKFFSRKGYFSTSMQEIAVGVGISKGSLYKYFESKEDLLMQVFKYNHDKMLKEASYISSNQSLVPKEKLKKMLCIEFEGILENRDYFNLITKSLPLEDSHEFRKLMRQIKAEMVTWHKEILHQVYGEKISRNIWDIVIVLQGTLKEYIHLFIQDKKKLKAEKIADFILFALDAIVSHQRLPAPVLANEMMREYEEWSVTRNQLSTEEQLDRLLVDIKHNVNKLDIEGEVKRELSETVALVEEEIKGEQPRLFLVKALLSYLGEWKQLEKDLSVMRNLLGINH